MESSTRAHVLEPDAAPAGARVRVEAGATRGRVRTLVVRVTNAGPVPVPRVGVRWFAEYDAPQPARPAGPPVHLLGCGVELHHPGGPPDLAPGAAAKFYLEPFDLPTVLSAAAALSPERCYLSVGSYGNEFHREPGAVLDRPLAQLEPAAGR